MSKLGLPTLVHALFRKPKKRCASIKASCSLLASPPPTQTIRIAYRGSPQRLACLPSWRTLPLPPVVYGSSTNGNLFRKHARRSSSGVDVSVRIFTIRINSGIWLLKLFMTGEAPQPRKGVICVQRYILVYTFCSPLHSFPAR